MDPMRLSVKDDRQWKEEKHTHTKYKYFMSSVTSVI